MVQEVVAKIKAAIAGRDWHADAARLDLRGQELEAQLQQLQGQRAYLAHRVEAEGHEDSAGDLAQLTSSLDEVKNRLESVKAARAHAQTKAEEQSVAVRDRAAKNKRQNLQRLAREAHKAAASVNAVVDELVVLITEARRAAGALDAAEGTGVLAWRVSDSFQHLRVWMEHRLSATGTEFRRFAYGEPPAWESRLPAPHEFGPED